MIQKLIKELEDAGFKVDDYSGVMDGDPVYVVDLYGHKKQKSQVRIVDRNWYTFRETINEIMRRVKSTSKIISL